MGRGLLYAALVALIVVAQAADVDESDVVVLTTSNFDETVNGAEIALVEFYAPWCGHCKALTPEYAKAATQLKGKVMLAKVDATEERELGDRFGVRGYPTLKVFRFGKDSEYKGGRDAKSIVGYMEKQVGPASKEITAAELEEFIGADDVAAVGHFAAKDNDAHKAFLQVASKLRDSFKFAEIFDGADKLVVHKKFDDGDAETSENLTAEGIEEFILGESLPLLGEIGPENYADYVERSNGRLVWLFIDPSADGMDDLRKEVSKSAAEYKGKVFFVWLDGVKYARQAEALGLSGKTPAIVLDEHEEGNHFVFPESETITADAFSAFLKKALNGEVQPSLRSEEEPAEQGNLHVVVGTTMEKYTNGDKNVLLEFYAPWCGHCKNLAPAYEKLADQFADNDDVIIAKIDATANDVPKKYNVRGFPTILFFGKGKGGEFVNYEGGRTQEAMAEYINEHAGIEASEDKKEEL